MLAFRDWAVAHYKLNLIVKSNDEARARVRKLKFDFCHSWPELAIHQSDGTVTRFRQPGTLATTWGDSKQRASTTISGAAFVDTLHELFSENN